MAKPEVVPELTQPEPTREEALNMLLAELKKGEADITAGRTITMEESKKKLGLA